MNLYENVYVWFFMFNLFSLFYMFRENDFLCFVFQVMDFWNYIDFQLFVYFSCDIVIIIGVDDIIIFVEESQVIFFNIRGLCFVMFIKV